MTGEGALDAHEQQHVVFYLYALEQLQYALPRCSCELGTILVKDHVYPLEGWLHAKLLEHPELLPAGWHIVRPPGALHGGRG